MAGFLDLLGSIGSLVGAIISAYVLWNLSRLRNHFLVKARLPDFISSLRKQGSDLSGYLNDFNSSQRQIETTLKTTESIVRNLTHKVRGDPRVSAEQLLKKISKRKRFLTRDYAWEIYNNLQALIESLKQFEKDIRWSG